MRDLNVLGMKLKDYNVKESLNKAEKLLYKGAVHTILYLTGAILLEAEKEAEEKAWIETADLTLWGDTESLQAVGITAGNRYREVDGKEFMRGFLYKLAKGHLATLILADSKEHAEKLREELQQLQDGVTVVGTFPLDVLPDNRENMINEINLLAPAAVIVRMPLGMQLKWLRDSKALLNTEVWLAIPEQVSFIPKKRGGIFAGIVSRIRRTILKRQVNKYIE